MTSNTIGERIKKLRENKGLTQLQLAKELSVKRETVNYWEAGTRDLKTEYTIKLADYFGVTCDFILRGINAENVDVFRELGLTEDSVCNLKAIKARSGGHAPLHDLRKTVLNELLSHKGFFSVVDRTARLRYEYEKNNSKTTVPEPKEELSSNEHSELIARMESEINSELGKYTDVEYKVVPKSTVFSHIQKSIHSRMDEILMCSTRDPNLPEVTTSYLKRKP